MVDGPIQQLARSGVIFKKKIKQREKRLEESKVRAAVPAAEGAGAAGAAAPEVTLEIYPLQADPGKLGKLLETNPNDKQLGAEDGPNIRFEIFGSFVYLIVIKSAVVEEVAFSIPVKWYKGDDVVNVALVSPYVFVEADNDAIIDREWNGRPTMDAAFSPIKEDDPHLQMKTDMLLPGGRKVTFEVLLEIAADSDARPPEESPRAKSLESEKGSPEHLKTAKVLALEILLGWRPVKSVMLRQFRDADDPTGPCYQEIMRIAREIKLLQIHRFAKAPIVRIYPGDSLSIVDILGLTVSKKEDKFSICEPILPFRLLANMEETSRKCVYWRAGLSAKWERSPGYDEKADNPPPVLGKDVLNSIKGEENLLEVLQSIQERKKDPKAGTPWGGTSLKEPEVISAVKDIQEPWEVISSIIGETLAPKNLRRRLGRK